MLGRVGLAQCTARFAVASLMGGRDDWLDVRALVAARRQTRALKSRRAAATARSTSSSRTTRHW